MNRLLLFLFFLLLSAPSWQQPNHLFVKKGIHKKKTFSQGDMIQVQFQNGQQKKGMITMLKDSIIFIGDEAIAAGDIAAIILTDKKRNRFPADAKTVLMIAGGVALTAIGLSLNGANNPRTALIAGAVIGFGPLLVKFIGGRLLWTLQRKKYRIGKKFHLQVFDIYPPPRRSF
jgi:hypothetical protein